MKNDFRFIAVIILSVALVFLSSVAVAESLSNAARIERMKINILSIPDWVEINQVEKTPQKLIIRLVSRAREPVPIATFYQDGPAFPELVSIFKSKVDGRRIIFVIVKWRYYLSGVDTEGDYYEVHAYEAKINKKGKIIFTENKKTSDFFGTGFDGKREGKSVNFRFKDASSIQQSLEKNWK